jgi:hypothetical protein
MADVLGLVSRNGSNGVNCGAADPDVQPVEDGRASALDAAA